MRTDAFKKSFVPIWYEIDFGRVGFQFYFSVFFSGAEGWMQVKVQDNLGFRGGNNEWYVFRANRIKCRNSVILQTLMLGLNRRKVTFNIVLIAD